MHPIEFKEKWKLTYQEMAFVLGYESYDTVRSWFRCGKKHRNPMKVVHITCWLLNEKWEREGKQIVAFYP
jgi:hypothetical protein